MRRLFLTGLTVLFLLVAPIALADPPKDPYGEGEIPPGKVTQPKPPSLKEELPFTGADLTLFAATGIAAIGTGVVVIRRTRPRDDGLPFVGLPEKAAAKKAEPTSTQ